MYFEKQGFLSSQCGRCTLNNLLGRHEFTSDMLNDICKKLSKEAVQDYKHILGGDYDVNVLIQALNIFHKQCKWLNGSQFQANKQKIGIQPNFCGFIINRKHKPSFFKGLVGLSDGHWVTVRQIEGKYYLFDSKSQKNQPEKISSLTKFLQEQINRGSSIIEVYDKC